MSASVIGALRAVLGLDSASFNDGADAAEKRLARLRKSMQRSGRLLSQAGQRMTAGLSLPLIGLAYKSVDAQKAQERAIASVDAALESMGHGAGFTRQELEGMASALQDASLYGDEDILSRVTANLLTFGNVSGDVFTRAQGLAVDLSARLGQDLQSSTILVGKALNDPIKGLSALTRVGVSFTEQQKEQIKAMAEAGNVAGAQTMILNELEKQYKGQALALAQTDSGRITQAWNAIGDATERVGAIILPIVAEFADRIKGLAERFQGLSPETQRFVVVGGALAAAIGPAVTALGLMMVAVAPMAGAIAAVVSPLGLMAAGITAGAVAIYQNWDSLKTDFPAITGAIEAGLSGLKAGFQRFADAAVVILQGIKDGFRLLATGVEALLNGDFRTALQVGVDIIRNFGQMIIDALGALVGDIAQAAMDLGRNIVDGLKAGIQEKWQDIRAYIQELAMQLPEWIRKPLGINSPSRVFAEIGGFLMDGLAQGIERGSAGVLAAMGSVTSSLSRTNLTDVADSAQKSFAGLGKTAGDVAGRMGRMFGAGVRGARSLKDALNSALQSLSRLLLEQAKAGLTDALGGGLGGKLVGGFLGGLMGFQNGGSFEVGGVGGIDSQIVAFRASPDETVHVTKPGQGLSGGGGFVWHGDLNIQSASDQPQEVAAETVEALRGMIGHVVDDRLTQSTRANGMMDLLYEKKGGIG
ncbi:phage tail length tape measure family protein [Tateyamaria sp. syn59]|uniref:phage tail length tape measure family protein n=1 Tax=Tateyamaria sp. syn59 TaxID=2576942 RepID=UPI0011BD80DB|nr:phage tail length tape measure family protein [Tateyamaria sp. syn59]